MKVFEILLCIILLFVTVLIGSPLNYNCLPINVAILLIGMVFIIYSIIQKKENIVDNKLDIVILILCLSPIIPIIFNSYISFTDSIISFIKYISCFMIYLITKKVLKYNKNSIKTIINVIIISSIILCIIGIDNMTTHFLTDFLESLGIPYVVNLENRMFANLGYANSFAIILAITIILIIDKIVDEERKKYGIIYGGFLFLNLACLILTLSRSVILLLSVSILFFILLKPNKRKTIYTCFSLSLIGIISLIYSMVWQTGMIWILTISLFIVSMMVLYILDKLYERIDKISKKTYIISACIIISLCALFVIIGLKLVVPLNVFKPEENAGSIKYKIQNIEPNKEYIFKFDIISKSTARNINNYYIKIEEENKYYNKIAEHEIKFNNYTGVKEIKFTTSNETVELALYIESKYPVAQQGLTINSLTINGEEKPLNYLYLPVSLVDKLKDINIKDKSVWERVTYYYDALKLIKENYLFGIGGNAWKYKYMEIQSYNYETVEVHSFILQILLENGIIAFIALLSSITIIILNYKKINKTILIAFFLLLLHSFLDFDMSFFYIMIVMFILLAIISNDLKENAKNKVLNNIFTILLIVNFCIGIIVINNFELKKFEDIYYNSMILLEENKYNDMFEYIKETKKKERYNIYIKEFNNIDYSKVSNENIEFIYEEILKVPITKNIEYNMIKNELICNIIKTTNYDKIKKEFALIIIEQNEKNMQIIQNKEKNRLTNLEIENYKKNQEQIYNYANEFIGY